MTGSIAEKWKCLSGSDHWKNLLDPLDIDLRHYLIHYGEMAQATYDTFNSEKTSKLAGDSRYAMHELFEKVGLVKSNPFRYEPTKYFYATSQVPVPLAFLLKSLSREAWFKESNWIGYVAVATDEGKALLGRRDIVIAWRGSIQSYEWINDFDLPLVSASKIFEKYQDAQVCSAWLSMYTSEDKRSRFNVTSARQQVLAELERLLHKYKDEEVSVTVTGHSMGAALAVLNATDIVANGHNKQSTNPEKFCPVTAFCFGCPHVGDSKFKDVADSLGALRILRIRNIPDVVTLHPTILAYVDEGQELAINTLESEYLKKPGGFRSWHNLECAYLHGIAGTQGSKGGFHLDVKRDIALINKELDALKDEYLVPDAWRSLENKGMVQLDDGSWTLDA